MKAWNCTALTLIPKVPSPTKVKDFRPIACCSTIYKVIAKILTNRIKRVLNSIIGCSQSLFIEGRNISDNILLSHKLFKGYTRKWISPRCVLKVDIRKAYDTLEWSFLQAMLNELGFPQKFIQWTMECVSTVSYSVMLNGGLTKPFKANRGLRQGDPMSPFLFVIAMEYLHTEILQLALNKQFHFHPRCKRFGRIYLCFADVLLMLCRADMLSVSMFQESFYKFSCASGLKANQEKSSIYMAGTTPHMKDNILQLLGYVEGRLPFKYLGVPLSIKKLTVSLCLPLVEKFTSRITCWSAKLLS